MSLLDPPSHTKRTFFRNTSRFHSNRLAILFDEYKMEWDVQTNTTELFHRTTDPLEKHPINEGEIF